MGKLNVTGIVFAFLLGAYLGALVAGLITAGEIKREAVSNGCANWVANEDGRAVFTWTCPAPADDEGG